MKETNIRSKRKHIVQEDILTLAVEKLPSSDMPLLPVNPAADMQSDGPKNDEMKSLEEAPPQQSHQASVQVKNRRKRYLDMHPEYFSSDLELAGPLAPS